MLRVLSTGGRPQLNAYQSLSSISVPQCTALYSMFLTSARLVHRHAASLLRGLCKFPTTRVAPLSRALAQLAHLRSLGSLWFISSCIEHHDVFASGLRCFRFWV